MTAVATEGAATGAARQPVVKSTKPGVIRYREHPAKSSAGSSSASKSPAAPTQRQQRSRAERGGREVAEQRRFAERQQSSRKAERDFASGGKSGGKSSSRKTSAPSRSSGRSNYQPVILAEFVLAVLLVAATPIATKKNPEGLSPYRGKDVVKIEALTLLYFLLALTSVGGRSWGRMGAWLGGLILLVVGLGEASNLAKDLNIFGSGKLGAAEGSAAAGEGSGGSLKGNMNG